MRSRVLIAVLLLGLGAFGGACMYGRQKDKAVQDDFVDISRLPAGHQELNQIIYGIRAAGDVKTAIEAIDKIAEKHPEDDAAQVYSAILHPMLNMQGIVYRMRFLVEKIDVAYIQSISALRAFKRNKNRRAPHIDAFFDFFTQPNPDQRIGTQTGPFLPDRATGQGGVERFQDWMVGTVAKDVAISLTKLRRVAQKYDGNNSQKAIFHYDIGLVVGEADANRAFQGEGAIPPPPASQTRRARKVIAEDLYALIADMEERMGIGHYLAAYDLEDLPRFVNSLTKKTLAAKNLAFIAPGQTAFNIHLQSPLEFHQELFRPLKAKEEISALVRARPTLRSVISAAKDRLKNKDPGAYEHFLTLRSGKEHYLGEARTHVIAAITARSRAMSLAKITARTANRQEFFMDPLAFTSRPGFTENILAKRLRELSSTQPISYTDRVTGEPFRLNVFKLFDASNPKIRDLKGFFPDHFQGEDGTGPEPFFGKETDGKDAVHFAWNYEYGKPTSWPDPTFGGVLPDATNTTFPNQLASLSRDASTRVLQMWLRLFML